MERVGTFTYLSGEAYALGQKQGVELSHIPEIERILFNESGLTNKQTMIAIGQLEMYYPSLLEELKGVADYFNRDIREHTFLDTAYLVAGGCSLGVLSSQNSQDDNPYVIRMYDLGAEISDFRMCSTNKSKAYKHSGFSVMFFGRSEGMNEHGLCVTFAACGLPVGNVTGMIQPKINGLNFMVIVRLLLETCQRTEEAVEMIKKLPIASNMNLLITDALEDTVIVETMNGDIYVKESTESYTIATNHALVDEVKTVQKEYLVQSEKRYHLMESTMGQNEKISKDDLFELMATPYPKGLAMHNYQEFFGTVYTALFDISQRSIYFSFGSPAFNSVHELKVGEDFSQKFFELNLPNESYGPTFWERRKY